MKLVHFRGLNCYHDCMITLAHHIGLPYLQSFAHLWSEDDLRYDPICRVFLTRRMPQTLASMGMSLQEPSVTQDARASDWFAMAVGDFALVGMDAYQVPWTPLYQLQHGPHYFIVQKGSTDPQICFDPTYELQGQTILTSALWEDAYALISVRIQVKPTTFAKEGGSVLHEAIEVMQCHLKTSDSFLMRAKEWICGDDETALYPAKYIDAWLSGRYLYRHFVKETFGTLEQTPLFQSQQYFAEWQAVKGGVYKAALRRQDTAVFDEACQRFAALMRWEREAALQIAGKRKSPDHPPA